ncbi:HpcH/HpaI aldolase/citrate lyase family protein [Paracraurococcus lichenis]|uniref:CoA ester lyase n=1 Tax=Paracraurococcus lichenis TaxID=3064888 RepID=A0ABT9E963_9PROT|nr:CoA ester lyase [Paracraurococcus sp. LOR1-02]MDO9712662.1 CoA ester lyase [Paracraurococcus sp. LOR1-02]
MSSKLLITGGDAAAFAAAFASGATSIALDLEDTVPDDRKAATRALVPDFLGQGRAAGCHVGLRISPLSTRDGIEDIRLLLDAAVQPDSLVLTKVESAAELRLLDELLGGPCAALPLNVIIETPRAIAAVEEIARASRRVEALSFGGKDLSKALGAMRAWEPLFHARAMVVNAARGAGLGAYDEPFHPRDDLEGLRQNCLRVQAMGFTGKSTTDPRHPAVINAVFARPL